MVLSGSGGGVSTNTCPRTSFPNTGNLSNSMPRCHRDQEVQEPPPGGAGRLTNAMAGLVVAHVFFP